MTKVISFTVFVGALLSCIFFGSSTLHCVILAIVSAALFAFDIFLFRDNKIKKCIVSLVSIALVVACLFIPSNTQTYGSTDYWNNIYDYSSALEDDNDKKADKIYGTITDKYGETDHVKYFKGLSAIANSDADAADEILSSFENKTICQYYLLKEKIIALRNKDNLDEMKSNLKYLYIEAAKYNPDWEYVLKKLGIFYLEANDYEEACYYMTKAFEEGEKSDGEEAYYLGVALFEQGLYDKAFVMFEQAYNLGVSEEFEGYIAAYCAYAVEKEETP